jgi:hypothetical protein
MERERRSAAVQLLLVFGGFGLLLAAAIVGGFEDRLVDALDAAGPWLAATGLIWSAATWMGLPARSVPRAARSRVVMLAAVWLAAAVLGAGVAGLVGHDGAALAAWVLATSAVAALPTRRLLG